MKLTPKSGTRTDSRYLLFRFWRFVQPHKLVILEASAVMGASVLLGLPVPLLTMRLIDTVIPKADFTQLSAICLIVVTVIIARAAFSFLQSRLISKLSLRVVHSIKTELLRHTQSLPITWFHNHHSAYISTRISKDCEVATYGLLAQSLLVFLRDIVTFLGGALILLYLHPRLAALVSLFIPVLILVLKKTNSSVRRTASVSLEAAAQYDKTLQETLSNIYAVQAFAAEKREMMKNTRALNAALRSEYRSQMAAFTGGLLSGATTALAPVVVLFYGGAEIMRHHLSIGQLVAFSSYIGYLFGPAERLAGVSRTVNSSLAALARIFEIMDTTLVLPPRRTPRREVGIRGDIEFRNVSFSYKGREKLLSHVNFLIPAKRTVALVGPSGIGKTTLINLIMGFLEPDEGQILIDGREVRTYDLRYLREKIGLIPQEPTLFSGSIRDNLRYGKPDSSAQDLIDAAARANVHDFIMSLKDGYDTLVGERGDGLSVGQKQRICIARAVLKDPSIFIFDEATSSVDPVSERLIHNALADLIEDRTCIIISHHSSLTNPIEAKLIFRPECALNYGVPVGVAGPP